MLNRRSAVLAIFSMFAMMLFLAPEVQAQTADATGTWKWTQQGFGGRRGGGGGGAGAPATQPGAPAATQPGAGARRGGRGGRGGPRDYSVKLKQEGDKVTGQIIGANFTDPTAPMDISEGTVKDGTITFKVVREVNGNQIVTTYKGKIEGDTIKGTSEIDFNGTPISNDWEATREKAGA